MIKNLLECNKDKVALALGYFDAVHIGHQRIFDSVKGIGNLAPAVFTFSNNIYELLGREVKEIYTFEERCRLIKDCGIENIYYLNANIDILNMRGADFLALLTDRLEVGLIAAGEDYSYGVLAENGTTELKSYCIERDIACEVKPLIYQCGVKVSSSGIRTKILEGDMNYVTKALGRRYFVSGTVVEGRKSGREIGYPTINMLLPKDILQPKGGVYSSRATIDGVVYKGVTNIGAHPTFGDYSDNVETHLIGYNGNLYGRTVILELVDFIRETRRFSSPWELMRRIAIDVKEVITEEL